LKNRSMDYFSSSSEIDFCMA